MKWTECLDRVGILRPKAAKLAARMLRKDPLVPTTWAYSLDLALTCQAKGAGPITEWDLQVIAANQQEQPPSGLQDRFDEDQRQGWDFAASIRTLAVEHVRDAF